MRYRTPSSSLLSGWAKISYDRKVALMTAMSEYSPSIEVSFPPCSSSA